jgi:hypothetical protein
MNSNKVLTAVAVGGSAGYLWWLNKPHSKPLDNVRRRDSPLVQCATPLRPEVAPDRGSRLEEAKSKARDLLLRAKDEAGAPGLVVGVSIDGKVVWKEGEID